MIGSWPQRLAARPHLELPRQHGRRWARSFRAQPGRRAWWKSPRGQRRSIPDQRRSSPSGDGKLDASHDGKMAHGVGADRRLGRTETSAAGHPVAAGRNLLLRRRDLGHFVETAADRRRHRENRRLVRLRCGQSRRSPQCACRRESTAAITSSCRGSTKSSPTSKDGREVASRKPRAASHSICRQPKTLDEFPSSSLQPPQ